MQKASFYFCPATKQIQSQGDMEHTRIKRLNQRHGSPQQARLKVLLIAGAVLRLDLHLPDLLLEKEDVNDHNGKQKRKDDI